MQITARNGNLHRSFGAGRELVAAGVRTESVGCHSVRLKRSGRILGIWQAGSGGYNWYPVGATNPQAHAVNAEDAVTA
jgi:hypothetical protein